MKLRIHGKKWKQAIDKQQWTQGDQTTGGNNAKNLHNE